MNRGDLSGGFGCVLLRSGAVLSNGIACTCRTTVMSDDFLHHVRIFSSSVNFSIVWLVSFAALESNIISISGHSSLTFLDNRLIDTVVWVPAYSLICAYLDPILMIRYGPVHVAEICKSFVLH